MKLSITVTVPDLRALVECSGFSDTEFARTLKMSRTGFVNKVRSARPWFLDELPALAEALNSSKRFKVSVDDLKRVIGNNIHLRGALESTE